MLSLCFIASCDFIKNDNYLNQDFYINASYSFNTDMKYYKSLMEQMYYYIDNEDQIKNLEEEDKQKKLEQYENIKTALNYIDYIKYYIKNKNTDKIYTNLDFRYDMQNYEENKFLHVIDLSNDYSKYYSIRKISNIFDLNKYDVKLLILKDIKSYSQAYKDMIFYNSIRDRIIKEGIIALISFVVGISILIYLFKRRSEYFFEKIIIPYEKINTDLKISIFLIISTLMLMYQQHINFFHLPFTRLQAFQITITSFYIFYLAFNFKYITLLIKDKDKLKNEKRQMFIWLLMSVLKGEHKRKSVLRKVNRIFILTILLGISIFGLFITINERYSLIFNIFLIYIVLYLSVVPIYVLKKVDALSKIIYGTDKIVYDNLDYTIDENCDGDLYKLAHNINSIKEEFKKSVKSQIKSERFKSELITNVSHDLKTPLTSIINYVDLLKSKSLSKEEQSAYIEIINRKSQRLKILIDDLFETSKITSGAVKLDIEKIDIVSILRQTLGELDEKIQKSSLDFRVNLPKDSIYVNLDGKKTWRVFQNLIINALKY